MNKFIALLTSFMLILTTIPVNHAWADDDDSSDESTSARSLSDAAPTEEEIAKERADEEEKMDLNDYHLSAITLFAVTLSAPVLFKHCGQKMSVMIFSGTALYYVAMEIMNWGEYYEASTYEVSDFKDNDDERDKQIEALEAARDQTQEAQEAVEKKAQFTKYAFYGFTLAAAVAAYEGFTDGGGSCKGEEEGKKGKDGDKGKDGKKTEGTEGATGDDSSGTGLGTGLMIGGGVAVGTTLLNQGDDEDSKEDGKSNDENSSDESSSDDEESSDDQSFNFLDIYQHNLPQLKEDYNQRIETAKNSSDAYFNYEELTRVMTGKTSSITIDEYEAKKEWIPKAYGKQELGYAKGFLQLAVNSIISNAHAATESERMGIMAGGAGAAALLLISDELGKTVAGFLDNGFVRAAFFGGVAYLTYQVYTHLEEVAEIMKDRVEMYNKMIAEMEAFNNDDDVLNVGGNRMSVPIHIPGSADAQSEERGLSAPCAIGANGEFSSDPECQCLESNGCKTSEFNSVNFDSTGLPSGVNTANGDLARVADSIYNGDFDAASMAGQSLDGQAAFLDRFKKKAEENANKKRKSEGRPEFDFKAAGDQLTGKLKSQMRSRINGMNAADRARVFGYAPPLAKESDKKKIAGKKKNLMAATSRQGAIRSGKKKDEKIDPMAGFSFKGLDKKKKEKKDNKKKKDAGYEYNVQRDINNNDLADIFMIISTRYLKTAYPVLFEEEEEITPSSKVEPKKK